MKNTILRSFPEKDNLEEIWDLKSTVRISTNEVNKARKFLHSKVSQSLIIRYEVSLYKGFLETP